MSEQTKPTPELTPPKARIVKGSYDPDMPTSLKEVEMEIKTVGGYQPTEGVDNPRAPKGRSGLKRGYTPTIGTDNPTPPDTKGMGVEDPTQDINSGITTRYNKDKTMYQLIPHEWETVLAKIFTMGAKKYAPNNWKLSLNTSDHENVIQDRLGSAKRHINAWQSGEMNDAESGCHHLGHAAWNMLLIMWYDMYKKKKMTLTS